MSSQIEGTQATLEDVLAPLVNENANHNDADVINYSKATEFAIARFIPLAPEDITIAMSNLEKYINDDDVFDV